MNPDPMTNPANSITHRPETPHAALANPMHSAEQAVAKARRELTSGSLPAFAKKYLPKYFSAPGSRMHREMMELLQAASEDRRARLAFAAPRGHAKSTLVTMAYVLWSVCTGREPYIVILSETSDLARTHLDPIRNELTDNARLRRDYPEVCEEPGVRPSPRRWTESEIETRNGVKISAHGVGAKIRGRRHKQDRPTLIIADDIESEATARSEERRRSTLAWFTQAVLHVGAPGANIVVVGTIPHYDSLLCNLLDPNQTIGWTARRYQAIERWPRRMDLWRQWEAIHLKQESFEGATGPKAAQAFHSRHRAEMEDGAKVLWPEREGLLDLMQQRATSHSGFDSEKQNEPNNPVDCLFDLEKCHYWDDEFDSVEALMAHLGRWGQCFGGCDPAVGRHGGRGDYSAIVVLLHDARTRTLYVVESDIARRPPSLLFRACIDLQKRLGWRCFGFESNVYQEWLGDQLERMASSEGVRLHLMEIENTKDKASRIQKLQPLLVSGKIKLCRRHTTLLNQLRQFPFGAYDDGPDALEMAFRTFEENYMGCEFEPGDPEYPEYARMEQEREKLEEEEERREEEEYLKWEAEQDAKGW